MTTVLTMIPPALAEATTQQFPVFVDPVLDTVDLKKLARERRWEPFWLAFWGVLLDVERFVTQATWVTTLLAYLNAAALWVWRRRPIVTTNQRYQQQLDEAHTAGALWWAHHMQAKAAQSRGDAA